MGAFMSLLAALFKTIFVRLPLGIWLAVIFCGSWVALERYYQPDYPLLPCTTSRPFELVNPAYPNNPGRIPQLSELTEQIARLNLGVGSADLAFGQVGYGALLGITFGLLLAWPCGTWKSLRNYSGFLLFPVRVVLLGVIYAGLFGAVGAWLASMAGSHLITSGYLAIFGLLMPILVPLPFWILRPLFPSEARRQANTLIHHARHEANTSLTEVAKHDPTLGDVTKGKTQQEWNYYSTVCGVFIGSLLAEKRGISAWYRGAVERQARKRLNKLFEKGEHGLTAVMQFSREQLERKSKFTTEVIVGLWLAMQMKGDLNPQRDRDLASSLGAHLIQGMNNAWAKTSGVGTVLATMFLWTGVAGLTVLALAPQQFEQQLAQLGLKTPAQPNATQPAVTKIESLPDEHSTNAADSSDRTAASLDSASEPAETEPTIPGSESTPASAPETEIPSSITEVIHAAQSNDKKDSVQESPVQPASEPLTSQREQTAEPGTAEEVNAKAISVAASTAIRQWSHSSGRTIQATARSYWNGAVELQRVDGRTAFVEIAQLSPDDRQVIFQQFATALDATNTLPGSLITRNWVDATGSRQVTAALVKATESDVELLRADGKLFSISVSQLSAADQAFAKEQLEAVSPRN